MKLSLFKNKWFKRIFMALLIGLGLLIAVVAACNIWVLSSCSGRLYDNAETVPHKRVAVMLGTNPKTKTGKMNYFYKHRIDAAVKLYQNGKIDRILISGDNSSTTYSEPDAMKADLMAAGIPDSAIYLDFAGFSTYDSMVRAKKVFGLSEFMVVSQDFHNKRAVYIARQNGIDAIGFNVQNTLFRKWRIKMELREILARVKAVGEVVMNKKPHFLGEPIEIK
jgi:SanA protein